MNRLLVRSLISAFAIFLMQSLAATGQPPAPSISFGQLPISKAQSPSNNVDPQGKIISTSVGINAVWNGAPVGGGNSVVVQFCISKNGRNSVIQTNTIMGLGAAGNTVQTINLPVGTVMYGVLTLKDAAGNVIAGPVPSPTYTVQ